MSDRSASLTLASRSQGTDQDKPVAGSGRRRRRQEDVVGDVDEQDLLPSPGERTPQPSRSYLHHDEELDDEAEALASISQPMDFQYLQRSYDDEDEALQAALRASMEDVPAGFVLPELPAKDMPIHESPPIAIPEPEPEAKEEVPVTPAKSSGTVEDDDEPARELSAGTSTIKPNSLTADEIRRARLARFQ